MGIVALFLINFCCTVHNRKTLLPAKNEKSVEIIFWNFNEKYLSKPINLNLEIRNLPFNTKTISLEHYQIDSRHSNAHSKWRELGSP